MTAWTTADADRQAVLKIALHDNTITPPERNELASLAGKQYSAHVLTTGTWSPQPHDPAMIAGILDGSIQSPSPSVVELGAGFLFYAGKVHSIAGESGAGKSMLAAAAAIEVLEQGGTVIWIDIEMSHEDALIRLHELGYDLSELSRFHYVGPTTDVQDPELVQLEALITSGDPPTMVVVDSVGEALNLSGKDSNTEEVSEWFRKVARRLAYAGASVILIDHVPKVNTAGGFAIGSQRKRAAIDVQFMLRQTDPFTRDVQGASTLSASKDRFGHFTNGADIALMQVSTRPTRITFEPIIPAATNSDGSKRYTSRMQDVSSHVESAGPVSGNAVKKLVGGDFKVTACAVKALIDEGYIGYDDTTKTYPKLVHLKPYTTATDPTMGYHDLDTEDVLEEEE